MFVSEFFTADPGGDGGSCSLCPHRCRLAAGAYGRCGVRCCDDGKLYSLVYGHPAALQVDPIEKKPLNLFLPGSRTFSIGTPGCNLACRHCQNHQLVHTPCRLEDAGRQRLYAPETIVRQAREHGCRSVAFTYNEPTVWTEYAIDIAECAHANDLKTVLVSNAFITPEAAAVFYPHIDAANFDLKAMSDDFYRQQCGGLLAPVLEAIEFFYRLGRHLEITNLVIPGRNDSVEMVEQLLDFVETRLNRSVPLHFSAFFPCHRETELAPTPPSTLRRIREQAAARGFSHLFLGNIG